MRKPVFVGRRLVTKLASNHLDRRRIGRRHEIENFDAERVSEGGDLDDFAQAVHGLASLETHFRKAH